MSTPPKYFIVGPSWVGDMVMSHTLLQLLANRPEKPLIDVLAPEWSHPVLARMPEVKRALSMPIGHGKLMLKQRFDMGKTLRSEHYSEAFILPNSFKSALIPFWGRIKKRTGWLGELRYGLLNDQRRLDKAQYPLMVERFAALAYEKNETLPHPLPMPRLQTNLDAREAALSRLTLDTVKPVVVLCPGAEFGPAKRWPAKYFAQVADELSKRNWQAWVFGSENDAHIAKQILSYCGHADIKDLTGKTTLGEAIDLMSFAQLVITNDSGLMHIAAALNIPLIALYGSSDPGFTPPLSQKARMLSKKLSCSPCFKRDCPLIHFDCMNTLSPTEVLQASDELLAGHLS